MIAIAAVDKKWGIGYKGDLLVSLPEDQKGVFRVYTAGNTVVFGRKTLQTFKDQKLLPKRINIILSRNPKFEKEGAIILHSTEELDQYKKDHPDEKIFIIGGAEIYNTLISICDEAIITKLNAEYKADSFCPNLDDNDDWELTQVEDEIMSVKGISFNVCHYKRKK